MQGRRRRNTGYWVGFKKVGSKKEEGRSKK